MRVDVKRCWAHGMYETRACLKCSEREATAARASVGERPLPASHTLPAGGTFRAVSDENINPVEMVALPLGYTLDEFKRFRAAAGKRVELRAMMSYARAIRELRGDTFLTLKDGVYTLEVKP